METETLYILPDAGTADGGAESDGPARLPGKADLPLGPPEARDRLFGHDRPAQSPAGKARGGILHRRAHHRAAAGGQGRHREVPAADGRRQLHRDRRHALPLRQHGLRVHSGGLPDGLPLLRLDPGGPGAQPRGGRDMLRNLHRPEGHRGAHLPHRADGHWGAAG